MILFFLSKRYSSYSSHPTSVDRICILQKTNETPFVQFFQRLRKEKSLQTTTLTMFKERYKSLVQSFQSKVTLKYAILKYIIVTQVPGLDPQPRGMRFNSRSNFS